MAQYCIWLINNQLLLKFAVLLLSLKISAGFNLGFSYPSCFGVISFRIIKNFSDIVNVNGRCELLS